MAVCVFAGVQIESRRGVTVQSKHKCTTGNFSQKCVMFYIMHIEAEQRCALTKAADYEVKSPKRDLDGVQCLRTLCCL